MTDWLDKFVRTGMPRVLELRLHADRPLSYRKAATHERIVAILGRIASDIEELARAKRVTDLPSEDTDSDPRQRLRRRLAEPPVALPRASSNKQWREAVEWFVEEHRKAGLPEPWGGKLPWEGL